MLAYLDTLIGFAAVMLGASLLITICTQIVSALASHRGTHLLWGVKTLFAQIDPAAYPHLSAQAEALARQVLTHDLVSDSCFSNGKVAAFLGRVQWVAAFFERVRLASAIRPNELNDILSTLTAGPLAGQPIAAEIQALQEEGRRLEAWFTAVMDRVSQRFATHMRIWTVAFAFILAFGGGLNSLTLLNDLYRNGALRETLSSRAAPLMVEAQKIAAAAPADPPAVNRPLDGAFNFFQFRWPHGPFSWRYSLGVAITALLLSLGAPFWYNTLKSLSNLKPVLASRQADQS